MLDINAIGTLGNSIADFIIEFSPLTIDAGNIVKDDNAPFKAILAVNDPSTYPLGKHLIVTGIDASADPDPKVETARYYRGVISGVPDWVEI